jgi:hypothetical protein
MLGGYIKRCSAYQIRYTLIYTGVVVPAATLADRETVFPDIVYPIFERAAGIDVPVSGPIRTSLGVTGKLKTSEAVAVAADAPVLVNPTLYAIILFIWIAPAAKTVPTSVPYVSSAATVALI